jgi:hypothetical protein
MVFDNVAYNEVSVSQILLSLRTKDKFGSFIFEFETIYDQFHE